MKHNICQNRGWCIRCSYGVGLIRWGVRAETFPPYQRNNLLYRASRLALFLLGLCLRYWKARLVQMTLSNARMHGKPRSRFQWHIRQLNNATPYNAVEYATHISALWPATSGPGTTVPCTEVIENNCWPKCDVGLGCWYIVIVFKFHPIHYVTVGEEHTGVQLSGAKLLFDRCFVVSQLVKKVPWASVITWFLLA